MARQTLHFASSKLDAFAVKHGFLAKPAYYLLGEIHITLHDGETLYSDEAHLWCEECARALHIKVASILGPHATDDHRAYIADCSGGEDTPAHCTKCGETLDHALNQTGCRLELDHYEDAPSANISPREAFVIARILDAGAMSEAESERLLSLARVSLDHIHENRVRT